mgnify:CR=1
VCATCLEYRQAAGDPSPIAVPRTTPYFMRLGLSSAKTRAHRKSGHPNLITAKRAHADLWAIHSLQVIVIPDPKIMVAPMMWLGEGVKLQ